MRCAVTSLLRTGVRRSLERCISPGFVRRSVVSPRSRGSLRSRGAMPRFAAWRIRPLWNLADPVGQVRFAGGSVSAGGRIRFAFTKPRLREASLSRAEGTGRVPRRAFGWFRHGTGQASLAIGPCPRERRGRESRLSLALAEPLGPASRALRFSQLVGVAGVHRSGAAGGSSPRGVPCRGRLAFGLRQRMPCFGSGPGGTINPDR